MPNTQHTTQSAHSQTHTHARTTVQTRIRTPLKPDLARLLALRVPLDRFAFVMQIPNAIARASHKKPKRMNRSRMMRTESFSSRSDCQLVYLSRVIDIFVGWMLITVLLKMRSETFFRGYYCCCVDELLLTRGILSHYIC